MVTRLEILKLLCLDQRRPIIRNGPVKEKRCPAIAMNAQNTARSN